MCDLFHFENFAEKLRHNIEEHQKLYDIKVDIEREINIYRDAAEDKAFARWVATPADTYEQRVRRLEAEGMTRSDAQAAVDAQDL